MTKDIFSYLGSMAEIVQKHDALLLERRFEELAIEMAGQDQARRIALVSMDSYTVALSHALKKAIALAKKERAQAIYFEYDLDNDWQSGFFICQEYKSIDGGDDEWACDWIAEIEGPEFPALSAIYNENHFDRTELAKGSTLFLVARTVAAFMRAYDSIGRVAGLAICMAFHDQDPIHRIQDEYKYT